MQLTKSASSVKERALSVLDQFKSGRKGDLQRLNVIMLAIRGKKVNFDKVLKKAQMDRSATKADTAEATARMSWSR